MGSVSYGNNRNDAADELTRKGYNEDVITGHMLIMCSSLAFAHDLMHVTYQLIAIGLKQLCQ